MSCYMSSALNKACPRLPPPQSPSYCPATALVTPTFSLTASPPLTEGTDIHFSPVPDFHHSFSITGGLIKSLLCAVQNFPNVYKGLQHLFELSQGIQEFRAVERGKGKPMDGWEVNQAITTKSQGNTHKLKKTRTPPATKSLAKLFAYLGPNFTLYLALRYMTGQPECTFSVFVAEHN